MKCPRCLDVDLVDGGPLSSSPCPRCGGGLIPDDGFSMLLEELKHTREEIRELAKLYGGQRLPCPQCRTKMSPLVLRGRTVDLCFGCGALWVDRGELEVISGDRHRLPVPNLPAVAAPAALVPAQTLVRIDERHTAQHLARFALAAWGVSRLIWAVTGALAPASIPLSLGALALAGFLSRRASLDVLPRARRLVRWRGWIEPTAPGNLLDGGETFAPETTVVMRRQLLGRRGTPLFNLDLVDAEGRDLVRLKSRLLHRRGLQEAQRYARALGVPVRFDLFPNADDELDLQGAAQTGAPTLLTTNVVRVDPRSNPGARLRRMALTSEGTTTVGAVAGDVATPRGPATLDRLLAEHFVILDDTGAPLARLFSTFVLGRRATIVVDPAGRAIGNVVVRRTFFADVFSFAGARGQRRATASVRHAERHARVVDGYGRVVGELEVGEGQPDEPRPATLHINAGCLTGEARVGLVALTVHAALCTRHIDV